MKEFVEFRENKIAIDQKFLASLSLELDSESFKVIMGILLMAHNVGDKVIATIPIEVYYYDGDRPEDVIVAMHHFKDKGWIDYTFENGVYHIEVL